MSSDTAHTVLLVDDHPVVRNVTRRTLEAGGDITVVGEAGSAAELFDELDRLATPPDVVVLDISLPDASGLAVLPRLRAQCPSTEVLVLTMHDNAFICRRALDRGAIGFLSKGCTPETLVASVHEVADGRRVVANHLLTARQQVRDTALTDRELEVLRMMLDGRMLVDIARILELSLKTVSTYRHRIEAKTGARNVEEMRTYAILHDLL